MIRAGRAFRAVVGVAFAGLILADLLPLAAQTAALQPDFTRASAASEIALPLPEDRGTAALGQALKRLKTTASAMMIVAHPDDEDGALLTYLSREEGVRTILFTLNRGEGGQNDLSADSGDALGLIRTNELLEADEFYGVKQLWGTEVDFGFSKTQEESFARWGHDRVLYDAVLAVRRERPQIILSTFVGGGTDGHGHHQVAGEIAQEVFKAAGDPKFFPAQLKDELQPWQPLAVYSMVPVAPITPKGMFDYATGKWAPARFKNYVTGEWTESALSADVTLSVGTLDPVLGQSAAQIANQGWGEHKSQYGGASPALSGPVASRYHLWAATAKVEQPSNGIGEDLFHNRKVNIDTSIQGLAGLVKGNPPPWLTAELRRIDADLLSFGAEQQRPNGAAAAHKLAPIYRETLELRDRVQRAGGDLDAPGLLLELNAKIDEFQAVLKQLLGLDLTAFTTKANKTQEGGFFRVETADETPRSVTPGEAFQVRVHTAQANAESRLSRVWLESGDGALWKSDNTTGPVVSAAPVADVLFRVQTPENAEPTAPYFSRPLIEQPYYDLAKPEDRLRSFAPYPLAAWAEFTFDGLPIRLGEVVQTLERTPALGGVYEPLVVTPSIGLRIEPEARILPISTQSSGGSALPVRVVVHAENAAEGTVALELPSGWHAEPTEATFSLKSEGDTDPILFSVTPAHAQSGEYTLQTVARCGGRTYRTGWRSVGYAGLRPYNLYRPAQLKTRKVDVKLATGLRIGYIMGTGDLVPEAIEGLGSAPHLLTAKDITSADLSAWNVIVVGIRAYSARPELARSQPRLNEFVRRGGTLIVQYQSADFPAPLPLGMGATPERVVEEQTPVKLLAPAHPLLNWPNAITSADFDGWVEERGHGFLNHWDAGYEALTETADAGQDPQQGGLLVAHPGAGTYVYIAYALHRQLPELVPGAYRILANLLSNGRETASSSAAGARQSRKQQ